MGIGKMLSLFVLCQPKAPQPLNSKCVSCKVGLFADFLSFQSPV